MTHPTAIIVGASSGMGAATAITLAQHGWRVFAAARRRDRLDQLAQSQEQITPVFADATVEADMARMITTAVEATGRVDLLVYATGANIPDRALTRLTPARWQELLTANLTGAFLCTQQVLPVMRQQQGGLIIYLSSAAVQRPDVSGVAYQASKHGIVGLAHGTRQEERANGIRTSVIFPGLCDTEILKQRPVPTPQDVLSQALAPEDVAAAVLFLAQLPPRVLVPELPLVPTGLWS